MSATGEIKWVLQEREKKTSRSERDQRYAIFVQGLCLRAGFPGHFSRISQPPFYHVPPSLVQLVTLALPVASEYEITTSQHRIHTHFFVVFLPFLKDT